MTRRERRVTGPRLRYIVAGEFGAVEYMTLGGLPLAIVCHAPWPAGEAGPTACDVLEGPCYGDGTVLGAWELCERWRAAGHDDEVIWHALEEKYCRWL